jgi:hypothetical protein
LVDDANQIWKGEPIMVKTVIGLFATSAIAHDVVSDLENHGFPRDDIRLIPEAGAGPLPTATGFVATRTPGIDTTAEAREQVPTDGSVAISLIEMGMPDKKAVYYSEAVRRGATLVCVTLDDDVVNVAKTTIDAHGSLDINNQAAQWRRGGWQDVGSEADQDVVLVQTTYVFEVPNREKLAS